MEETKPKKKPTPPKGKPFTAETAREKGALGGIKTAENRQKKRILSDLYAEYLAKANGVDGYTDIKDVISTVLERGDSASVSMLKEIREATESKEAEPIATDQPRVINIVFPEAKDPRC
jgi:hypothetical protein